MPADVLLAVILLLAVIGKANSVGVAVGILLVMRLLGIDKTIPVAWVEKGGMFWGLVLLTMSVLSGFVWGKFSPGEALGVVKSWTGIVAFSVSLLFTWLTGRGLYFLSDGGHAEFLPALVFGAVIAAIFLKGVPVGPLTTSGVLYLIFQVMNRR